MAETWHYTGVRTPDGKAAVYRVVTRGTPPRLVIDRRLLPAYLNLCNHSPGGFEWGYSGSGPAQLAFAIVFDTLKRTSGLARRELVERAWRLHQAFKRERIATLPTGKDWRIDATLVATWIGAHQ